MFTRVWTVVTIYFCSSKEIWGVSACLKLNLSPKHIQRCAAVILAPTWDCSETVRRSFLRNICPLRLTVSACRALLCIETHVHICSACCHWDLSIVERIFLTCHWSKLSNPHSCAHKSSAEARMKHKCGMSQHSWTCVSSVSRDICSQKATIFTRQSPSRHFGPSQPNAPGWFGRKTRARFQCLLWKINPYLRRWAKPPPHGRIKICKGNSSKMLSWWRRFKTGSLTNKNSCRVSRSAGPYSVTQAFLLRINSTKIQLFRLFKLNSVSSQERGSLLRDIFSHEKPYEAFNS